jgi:hypothetical protein
MDKVDRPDKEKAEWVKLEFLMDPENTDSDYKCS